MFSSKNGSIKIFADGGNLDDIEKYSNDLLIDGLTTNPTLMRKSGVTNYLSFSRQAAKYAKSKSLSLEVFSDDLDIMVSQALKLSSLSESVYVKIPITNSIGVSTAPVISHLAQKGVKVNVTAILTLKQVEIALSHLSSDTACYLSIFAGRIADTGIDPKLTVVEALGMSSSHSKCEIIWASTREIYNVYECIDIGCDIITVPSSMLSKLNMYGQNLDELSLSTVKMFKNDADKTGYVL